MEGEEVYGVIEAGDTWTEDFLYFGNSPVGLTQRGLL